MQVYIDNHRNKRVNGIRQALINLEDWDSLDTPYSVPDEHIEDYHPFYPTVESYIVVNSCSWNDLVKNYLLKRKQERSIQALAFPNTLLDSRPPTDQEILDIYLCASNYTLSHPLTIEFLG